MAEYQIVCRTTDIAEGEAKCFEVNGQMIGVYHLPDGFYAIDDPCPHAGASLVRGCIEGEVVRCRIHNWGFGIKDGLYVDQEIPQHKAKTYPVQITGDRLAICTLPS